jgi:hypothetical protein
VRRVESGIKGKHLVSRGSQGVQMNRGCLMVHVLGCFKNRGMQRFQTIQVTK